MIRWLALVIVFLSLQEPGLAQGRTMQGEKIARALVAQLYAVPPENFEFGEFAGRPDSDKQRDLLARFLEPALIIKNKNDGFYATGDGNFFRFPQAGSEELSPKTRYKPLPTWKITDVVAESERVRVDVKVGVHSRVQYFLRPHGEQWRIYKVRTFEHWPLDKEEQQRLEGVTEFPPSDSFTSLSPW